MSSNLIIFDWKWTLYHPPSEKLMPGAYDLLEWLQPKDTKILLIGKDQGGDMNEYVDRLGVRDFFTEIVFINGQKTPELFLEHVSNYKDRDIWVVGDRVKGEIAVGNKIGARTVWFRSSKFADELPMNDREQPYFVVDSLMEIKELILQR